MLIDTHCHLDAPEFSQTPGYQPDQIVARAINRGIGAIVVPAVSPAHFESVRVLAHTYPQVYYAVGTHPMYVSTTSLEAATAQLADFLTRHHDDPKLLAVGEIGLDGFVDQPSLTEQIPFFIAQLKLAKQFDLPVIVHARKAVDLCSKYFDQQHINQAGSGAGIVHAFNGSFEQASRLIKQGFCLGFGGNLSFERARQIRRLATELPESAIVLETDAPDIPPAFLQPDQLNEPSHLFDIASTLAQLRGVDVSRVALFTSVAARHALPKLRRLSAIFYS
jgi:TatD DNase family protein